MTDIAIITSLYRTDNFLPTFLSRLETVAAEITATGLSLEAALVVNDATPTERALIDALAARAPFGVVPCYVARETIYASWNRGVAATTAPALAVWNVDDERTGAALIEGVWRINEGCAWVDFPYIWRNMTFVDQVIEGRDVYRPLYAQFGPGKSALMRLRSNPFFVFSRDLYDQAGPFDTRFRIAGDSEWQIRASAIVPYCQGEALGGVHVRHGANLSTANHRYWVENNIICLLHNDIAHLTPAEPQLMRATCTEFGLSEQPPEVANRLWGSEAGAQYHALLNRQQRRRVIRAALRPLRAVMDRLGLRPLLSRFGLALPPSK